MGTPVGVVVIPPDFLPDGKMRIMSLYEVNEDGTRDESKLNISTMPWCRYNTDIPELENLEDKPIINLENNTIIEKTIYDCYLPSDYVTEYPNPWDIGTAYYHDPTDSSYKPAPSPYGTDGALNPLYVAAEYSGGTINNAFADFKGKENTDILVGLGSDYVAANAARNYKSYDGDTLEWYLPSCGELGFSCARWGVIRDTIIKVADITPFAPVYFTSTEDTSSFVSRISLTSGHVGSFIKSNEFHVRAFAQI